MCAHAYEVLVLAILEQAISDYRYLRKRGLSTQEVEDFFLSDWCDELTTNLKLDGKAILEYLRIS